MRVTAHDYFEKVEDISREYLVSRNISGIILDIDNTIVIDGKTEVSQSVAAWLMNIGLPVCLLSNGRAPRVKLFAEMLEVNYISQAKKPSKNGYAKAAGLLGIANMTEIAVVGDQLYSDILGGNRAGCYTIKVEPIDSKSDPPAVKAKRLLERIFSK